MSEQERLMKYAFPGWQEEETPSGKKCVLGSLTEHRFSERLKNLLGAFETSHQDAFPRRSITRIALRRIPWNGASGEWSQSSEGTPPTFAVTISIDMPSEEVECSLAHEVAHAMVRLRGVKRAKRIGPISRELCDEFSSACQHPYVFDLLNKAGYREEQEHQYRQMAGGELLKLLTDDFSRPHYTRLTPQTKLALWTFSLQFLALAQYQEIKKVHRANVPELHRKPNVLEGMWNKAWRQSLSDWPKATSEFQRRALKKLDLRRRIRLESREEWTSFLFSG